MRDKLAAIIGPRLGVYTLKNGAEVPAASVGDPDDGTTAAGLELLVNPNPKIVMGKSFCPTSYSAYLVRLVNHDDDPDILEAATNAVAAAIWPFYEDPALLPASADYPEQVTFSLILYP